MEEKNHGGHSGGGGLCRREGIGTKYNDKVMPLRNPLLRAPSRPDHPMETHFHYFSVLVISHLSHDLQ